MRYQPDHKEKTRRRVLEEATKAIRRQGPHRLGIARVMKQAGLTHGGFYAHFSSKDALVSAAIAGLFGSLSLARCEPDRERSDAILVAARQSLLRRLGLRRPS